MGSKLFITQDRHFVRDLKKIAMPGHTNLTAYKQQKITL